MKSILLTALVVSLFGINAKAADTEAAAKLEAAKASYEKRANAGEIENTLKLLGEAQAAAEGADLKFDILVLTSRANYWKGVHTSGNGNKKVVFQAAMDAADAAKALNSSYAEGYYFKAISRGRWAEANGVTSSLKYKQELIDTLTLTKFEDPATQKVQRKTKLGAYGETLDGYGADRVLGRVYFKLPGFAGGNRTLALKFLGNATQQAPSTILNSVYFAEALGAGNDQEKAQACQVLKETLARDPKSADPAKVPENLEDYELAKQLNEEICK